MEQSDQSQTNFRKLQIQQTTALLEITVWLDLFPISSKLNKGDGNLYIIQSGKKAGFKKYSWKRVSDSQINGLIR